MHLGIAAVLTQSGAGAAVLRERYRLSGLFAAGVVTLDYHHAKPARGCGT